MSAIINPPVATGLSSATPSFDFERQGSTLPAALAPTYRSDDGIRFDPTNRSPIAFAPAPPAGGFADWQVDSGRSQFAAIVSLLLGSMSSLLASIVSYLNGSGQPTRSGAAGERHFAHATASSTGDPHEAFHGTARDGKTIDATWDSMTSHENLLSSNSFDGGYRVSNVVTHGNAAGVTMNDRVTVATDGGNTSVTMKEDGSYDVSSFGRNVALQTGVATHLSDGETVTKNADGSLTIDDSNGRGGTIETTLRSNGAGGVDAKSSATDVDLGGYLVDKNDGDRDPVAAYAGAVGAGFSGASTDVTSSYGAPSYVAPSAIAPTFGYVRRFEPYAATGSDEPLASDATFRTQPSFGGDASNDGAIEA